MLLLSTLAGLGVSSDALPQPAPSNHSRLSEQGAVVSQHEWMHRVTLLAWEERDPPDGLPPRADRPIGFASVFLYLENPGLEDVTIVLETIEIQTVDGQPQAFEFSSTDIRLRPLEHSELVFHLSSTVGYCGDGPVQVIATYRVGDRHYHLTSEPVEIQR
ncbi:MAG: hypothetical protein EA367_08550 [Leptolyngbya sp. DLM2.Bin15]|nr:MAG: hypothetical protein EA367_08550 [Leptolyngbya sp. DLM2.Bin15]